MGTPFVQFPAGASRLLFGALVALLVKARLAKIVVLSTTNDTFVLAWVSTLTFTHVLMGVPAAAPSVAGKGGRLNTPDSLCAVVLTKSEVPLFGSAGEAKPSKSAGVKDWSAASMQYHIPSALVGLLALG